ncbi:MAG: metallophosphoesterase [Actinobacteria bacterium]|nr:metallophosphoesterase [Actinomycetota bacterium]
MTAEIILIILITIIIVFVIVSLLWYAFRFEVTNFKIVNNTIYVKPITGSSNHAGNAIEDNLSNLERNEHPLKILHLSDFHLRKDFKGKKLENFIKTLSFETYDFIFITGDMVEKNELQDKLIETLKTLKAGYGIYAVFGAHDYYNKKPVEFIKNMFKKRESYSRKNDVEGLRKKLEFAEIKVLQNESIILKDIGGYNEIDIIGVDDPIINKMDLEKSLSGIFQDISDIKITNISPENLILRDFNMTDISKDSKFKGSVGDENKQHGLKKGKSISEAEKILEDKIPENQKNRYLINTEQIKKTQEYKETFILSVTKYHELRSSKMLKIALVHTPDSYALVNLAVNGIDIVFAGHTHGGQIRIPKIGALISGCSLKTKYAAGLFYFKNFVLQVSKGLGEGRFSRFRIHCDPEAIITTIKEI